MSGLSSWKIKYAPAFCKGGCIVWFYWNFQKRFLSFYIWIFLYTRVYIFFFMKHWIIGIDEAWRGAWAWPVVAACFACQVDFDFSCWSELDDSKKLTPKKRELLFENILKTDTSGKYYFSVGMSDAECIDTVGIREANRRAMLTALQWLPETVWMNQNISIYIDGRDNYQFPEMGEKLGDIVYVRWKRYPSLENIQTSHPRECIFVIEGDSVVPCISAASIVAKVTRDKQMCEFDKEYVWYDFSLHKGYGTKKHMDALINNTITNIHRKSYAPVKKLISTSSRV